MCDNTKGSTHTHRTENKQDKTCWGDTVHGNDDESNKRKSIKRAIQELKWRGEIVSIYICCCWCLHWLPRELIKNVCGQMKLEDGKQIKKYLKWIFLEIKFNSKYLRQNKKIFFAGKTGHLEIFSRKKIKAIELWKMQLWEKRFASFFVFALPSSFSSSL